MMRFARAALLPLVMLCLVAGTADAQMAGAKLVSKTLAKRAYKTNTAGDASWVQVSSTAGYLDSLYWSWNVAGASTTPMACTTSVFTLENWAPIPTQPGNTVTAVDTLYGFELSIFPSPLGTATAAFDTAGATLQGSFDGTNWAAAPQVRFLEIGSTNAAQRTWNVIWSVGATGTLTNANVLHMPLLRFILHGGGTYGGTDSGQFAAMIRYFTRPQSFDSR